MSLQARIEHSEGILDYRSEICGSGGNVTQDGDKQTTGKVLFIPGMNTHGFV